MAKKQRGHASTHGRALSILSGYCREEFNPAVPTYEPPRPRATKKDTTGPRHEIIVQLLSSPAAARYDEPWAPWSPYASHFD